tara:strand:- start:850 stop:1065 length:216 start_codon:yes stop_codon:yes gene_type:complete
MALAPLPIYIDTVYWCPKTILFERATIGGGLLKYKAEFLIGCSQFMSFVVPEIVKNVPGLLTILFGRFRGM